MGVGAGAVQSPLAWNLAWSGSREPCLPLTLFSMDPVPSRPVPTAGLAVTSRTRSPSGSLLEFSFLGTQPQHHRSVTRQDKSSWKRAVGSGRGLAHTGDPPQA